MSSSQRISLPPLDTPKLNSKDDYEEWARGITNWLIFNNLEIYVNGTSERPDRLSTRSTDSDAAAHLWDELNAKTKAGLLHTISAGPHLKVHHVKTAKEIWDKLREDYQPTGAVVFATAVDEMLKCRAESFSNVQLVSVSSAPPGFGHYG